MHCTHSAVKILFVGLLFGLTMTILTLDCWLSRKKCFFGTYVRHELTMSSFDLTWHDWIWMTWNKKKVSSIRSVRRQAWFRFWLCATAIYCWVVELLIKIRFCWAKLWICLLALPTDKIDLLGFLYCWSLACRIELEWMNWCSRSVHH